MAELKDTEGGVLVPHPAGNAPFEGEGKTLAVTKPVNAAQLLEEVYDRLGDHQKYNVVLASERDPGELSEEHPGTLHVHPADADMRKVRGVVESHVPDPDWGLDEDAREIRDLKAKLAQGDLDQQQMNVLLRRLVGA